MKNVTEFGNLPAVSIRSMSQLLEIDRDTVRSAIERAGLAPVSQRGGHPAYDFRETIKALFSRKGIDVDPNQLSPADRRALAQARMFEHDLQVKSAAYLPRQAVRDACGTAFAMVAQSIRSIPDLCERKTGATPETCELIAETIHSVCADLAERMEAIHRESTT